MFGCNNDRLFLEKYPVKDHISTTKLEKGDHSVHPNTAQTSFSHYASVKSIEASTCPPGHTPGIWHLCRPGEKGIWLSESSKGWGIWSPCFRGGEFELQPRFHVNLWRGEHWGARCYRIFVEKIVPLWPIGYEEKAYTSFVAYWKNLNFKLFKYWIQALNVWM